MRPPARDRPTDVALARPLNDAADSAVSSLKSDRSWRASPLSAKRLSSLPWLLPLTIAAVYLVIFVIQIPHNLRSIMWLSDYSSGFAIVETVIRHGTGGNTMLGPSGHFLPLLFGLLTARLPLHRELWEIAPTSVFLSSALIVGWCVARVSDRRAAILAILLVIVASPKALVFLMAPVAHNTVFLATASMGAYLIWLTRAGERRRALRIGVPVLAGVAVGTCLGSDLLIAPTAVLPLALTGVLAALRRNRASRMVALSALATAAISVPVAVIFANTMESLGFLTIKTPVGSAQFSTLSLHARLMFEGLKVLFNGYLASGAPGTLHTELGTTSIIVMSAAFLTLLLIGIFTTIKFMRVGLRRRLSETPDQLARSLHIIYWVGSGVTVCAAFLLTVETTSELHESYYATTILSVAAVVPLVLRHSTVVRWIALTGAALLFSASLAGLTSNYLNMEVGLRAERIAPEVERLARANNLAVGYAGYFEASNFTWITHGRLTVRPVLNCSSAEGTVTFCPFLLARVGSWYVPQRRHTFLLVDSSESWLDTLPTGLGRPLADYSFGSVRMLVYPYDIASRIGPFVD